MTHKRAIDIAFGMLALVVFADFIRNGVHTPLEWLLVGVFATTAIALVSGVVAGGGADGSVAPPARR